MKEALSIKQSSHITVASIIRIITVNNVHSVITTEHSFQTEGGHPNRVVQTTETKVGHAFPPGKM